MKQRASSPRLVIRVAAGPRLGYGHLMRMRALAGCLDVRPIVSVRGGAAAKRRVAAMGWSLAAGLDAVNRADVLVVDDPSFEHGRAWIDRARRLGVRAVTIHDDAQAHDADLVVCGSIDAPRPNTIAPVLQGSRFYLLDETIARTRRPRRMTTAVRSARVLIALGGGHHVRSLAQRLADAIHDKCAAADVVVAAGFSRGRRRSLRHARWLIASNGLVPAFADCDVAIVAGGVTLYEACALGVPSVGLAVVPAQRRAIRAFSSHGAVLDAGGAPAMSSGIHSAAAAAALLLADRGLRTTIGLRAKRLVDGRGAARVAARIRALVAEGARVA